MVGFYLYNRVDEEIRTQVETLLAQQYPHLVVSVRSARLLELEGFEIRGVSLAARDKSGVNQPVLVADKVLVRCNAQLDELLRGRVEVKEIIARRVAARCARQSDGGWTIQQIAKLPTLGGSSLPTIRLENSTLEIVDVFQKPQRIYTLRDVNALVAPVGTQQATNQNVSLSVQASASGDHLQRFTIEGEAIPNTGQWQIKGNQIRIDLSPTLRDSLPVELSRHMGVLGSLVAKSEVNFDIAYDPRKPTPMTYKVGGRLRNGRLEDPRLPYPLMALM